MPHREAESTIQNYRTRAAIWKRAHRAASVTCILALGLSLVTFGARRSARAQGEPPTQAQAKTQGGSKAQTDAQQPPPNAGKIAVLVRGVTLYATARDKHGKIVSTFNKEDFTLEDNGNPQTITYFAREAALPLTLGPLVDTSFSQRNVLGAERDASFAFLDHMLRPDKDKAFLVHFDREVELLQDLTASRDKLKRAIQELETPALSDSDERGGRNRGGGTLLYDAIFLASNELMKKQQGRKALIILSDGVDHGSKETLTDAAEAAQRADTAVYSILFADRNLEDRDGFDHGGRRGRIGMGGPFPWPQGPGGGRGPGGGQSRYPERERTDGKKVLEQISSETGGRFFEVSKKLPIDQIYAQIEEELRNQYSLGYTPSPADSSGAYHKIRLSVKDKDVTVFARAGYYASP